MGAIAGGGGEGDHHLQQRLIHARLLARSEDSRFSCKRPFLRHILVEAPVSGHPTR